MELFFEINNQKMERIDIEDPVNSSEEYLKLSFDFKTDDWDDTTKFIFFRVHHINYSYPLTDDSIIVPAVFLNSKHLDFGVYGVGGEDYRITTNSLRIKFRESKFWSLSDAPLSITELINKLFDEKADLTYVDIELADKVDKIDGKELSSNDFTDEYLNLIETHQENINDLSVNKVDKVTGKELSSNDFTDYYKNFLDGFDGDIEAFLLEHKEEIEALITSEVLAAKADKSYVDSELSERDAEINLKSDKSYVDGELDKKADITYVDSELNERDTQINLKSDKTYVDTELNKKSDSTYVDSELSKKANIVHTHTESDITDLQDYALSNEVYLKSEVDELLYNLNNRFVVNSTSDVVQVGENTDIYAHTLKNGMPCIQKKIHFFEKISPVISLSSSVQVISTGDDAELYARVRDEDGSCAVNTKVHFFEKIDPAIKVSASQSILETGDDLDVYAKVYDTDGSLVQNTKAHFYRSIFADVYDKGEGNYYFSSNYLTQTVTEDGVLITDNHPDTAPDGTWYRFSLPPNVYPSSIEDLDNLCAFSTNQRHCIELDIIDSTDTSQMILLRPHIPLEVSSHEQTLAELSNNNSFHLKIEVINGVSYWYVDNNPTPVYLEESIDLGDAFAFRFGIHKQQSLKFDNLIIYKI